MHTVKFSVWFAYLKEAICSSDDRKKPDWRRNNYPPYFIPSLFVVCAIRKDFSVFYTRCHDFQREYARLKGTGKENVLFNTMTKYMFLFLMTSA